MSTCRSCGAEIIWAVTESGRRIPMDAAPVKPKGLFILQPDGDALIAYSTSSAVAPLLYQSHFATCPNADEHRR